MHCFLLKKNCRKFHGLKSVRKGNHLAVGAISFLNGNRLTDTSTGPSGPEPADPTVIGNNRDLFGRCMYISMRVYDQRRKFLACDHCVCLNMRVLFMNKLTQAQMQHICNRKEVACCMQSLKLPSHVLMDIISQHVLRIL